MTNLKRLDERQRGLDAAISRMEARRGVPLLALRKGVLHGIEDRITVLIQVAGADPSSFAGSSASASRGFRSARCGESASPALPEPVSRAPTRGARARLAANKRHRATPPRRRSRLSPPTPAG